MIIDNINKQNNFFIRWLKLDFKCGFFMHIVHLISSSNDY